MRLVENQEAKELHTVYPMFQNWNLYWNKGSGFKDKSYTNHRAYLNISA